MIKTVLLITLARIAGYGSAQTTNASVNAGTSLAEKLETYLLSAKNAYRFNGVALIEQNGKILLHRTYSWKAFNAKTLNDTLTKFPILSITKSLRQLFC